MNTAFVTDAAPLQSMVQKALNGIRENTRPVHGYAPPVMNEGGMYDGIWLEGGGLMGLIYGEFDPQAALRLHMAFIANADEEGFLPPSVSSRDVKTGHVQTVVPFARTALAAVKRFGLSELLEPAYVASVRYDDWLTRYRNRQGTDLVEIACHWDTGHDNSPRHDGQPDHFPDYDTKRYPDCPYFLAPDLSATKYGGRLAMAEMARMLGRVDEADRWLERAESLRRAIFEYTFDEADRNFYDRRDDGTFNRCKSDALTRVLQEHIPDQTLFEELFAAHIDNPKEFWTPYPLPSMAADDPKFVRYFPVNNWGGASQAHAAMRVPLWMEYYGKFAHERVLMEKWVEAILRAGEFRQQMNPFSGAFSSEHIANGGYCPAMCVLLDFVGRLYGVKWCEDGTLLWGCTKAPGASLSAYRTVVGNRRLEILNADNCARIRVDDVELLRVYGDARVRTTLDGTLIEACPTGVGRIILEPTQGGSAHV